MSVDFLPFLAISVLLILIPGPDTAVVTKNALVGGRRAGVFAAVGVTIGLTVWTIAAALGIAALLQASAVAFFALKIVGAIYLIWIGIQMLRARDLTAAATAPATALPPDGHGGRRSGRGSSATSRTRRSPSSSRASCPSSSMATARRSPPCSCSGSCSR